MEGGLFPSASAIVDDNSSSKKINTEGWLINTTFDNDSSKTLHSSSQIDNLSTASDVRGENFVESPEINNSSTQDQSDISSEEDSKYDDTSRQASKLNDFYAIDLKPNKDNLYFGRPYKVLVPKYYIDSDICVGLPSLSGLKLKSKRGKLRKNRLRKERYYYNKIEFKESCDVDEELKARTTQLNKITNDEPENIHNWFSLVDLQDSLYDRKKVKTIHERKISILDKAIRVNPKHLNLKLKRMELLSVIAEDTKRDWDNLIFQHPLSLKCWKLYIEHFLSSSNFSTDKSLKAFSKCLKTLNDLGACEHDKLVIIQMLIKFLIDCGKSELCLYLMLVMVEVNVRSTSCNDSDLVKHFVESGDRLLGEDGSKGWDSWHNRFSKGGWNSTTELTSCDESDDDLDVDCSKSLAENWTMFESARSLKHVYPWRHETECEDAERSVAIDDVLNFVIIFKDLNCRLMLFKLLIQLLGGEFSSISFTKDCTEKRPAGAGHPGRYLVPSEAPLYGYLGNLHSLDICDFKGKYTSPDDDSKLTSPSHSLLKLIIEQMIETCSDVTQPLVGVLCIQYYTHLLSKPCHSKKSMKALYKEAKKCSKAFIALHQANFQLWGTLAELEFHSKKLPECKKLLLSALMTCKCPDAKLYLASLFSQYFFRTDANAVDLILSSFVDPGVLTPALFTSVPVASSASTLRAGKKLYNMCEDLSRTYRQKCETYNHQSSSFMYAMTLYLVFDYLHSTDNAGSYTDYFLSCLRQAAAESETIQAAVDLEKFHTLVLTCSKCKVTYRRDVMRALDDFPHHPKFLLLMSQLEMGSSIFCVARKHFSPMNTEALVIFAVYFEILHLDRSGCPVRGNPRVCNLLERGLSKHPRSVLLWRMFAVFTNDTKTVITRALVSCPWSKVLVMDLIRHDPASLADGLKILKERSIRLHTPLEEVQLLLQMSG